MPNQSSAPGSPSAHTWKFIRIGGLDQVAIESGADLAELEKLDPKLWVALACPTKGLEFDEKTLQLIDADKDGRVRLPEVIAAVRWALARLKHADDLAKGGAALPLAAIDDSAPEGSAILASARQILISLGKPDADAISVEDAADTARIFAKTLFNGDGILPAESAGNPAVKQVIADIIATEGAKPDRSGLAGVDQALVESFFTDLTAFADWSAKGEAAAASPILTLGGKTAAAAVALRAVAGKIDDYFNRCRLAAFDARAASHLNRAEAEFAALASKDLSVLGSEIAALPLARIEAGRPLPLSEGVNPAWSTAVAKFQADTVAVVLGAAKTTITEAEWAVLKAKVAAYETWMAAKAGAAVEKLGLARIREILASNARTEIAALLAKDLALAGEMAAIDNVDRLARYYRDLARLLKNFVNFADFYDPARPAIFQAGTLFLDSRHCDLCIRIDDPGAHAVLATMSKCYIAYCDLRRPGETMKVAAVFSNGDSDYLMPGRNGLFVDRKGRDWDATITKVIDNPISIRQAFWGPYKKFVRLIEEQVAKRAAAAESASDTKLSAAATATANADKAAGKSEPKKIDIGTVAALGVAVGAIGGALGAIATGLAKLAWWQLPLVLVVLVLVISLPAVLIAWLKLRQRTLGPILEANGWAINGRVKINIPLGSSFTALARLPANARRSLQDPYEDKAAAAARRRLVAIVVLAVLAAVTIRVDAVLHRDASKEPQYFWSRLLGTEEKPKADTPAAGKAVDTSAPVAPATPAAPVAPAAAPAVKPTNP
jgi:hypothetical protein